MDRYRAGLIAQSLVYVASGANHFVNTPFYVGIMPDHYRNPALWVRWTGVAEIAGGVGLLVPATRRLAAGSLAVMLLGFLDVHAWMLRRPERFPGVPVWALWARLPLQFGLVAWAGWYARRRSGKAS